MVKKVLLANGDSWTFGSEIMAPEFCVPIGENGTGMCGKYKPGFDDWREYNDYYRIPRTWPSYLASYMNMEAINISFPARSNDTIYEDTVNWLLENYITKDKDTSELLVVLGWSSPERKNVMLSDPSNDHIHRFTIWPSMVESKFYHSDVAQRHVKHYVKYQWIEQEYLKRYIEQNYQFQNFCKVHKIDYYVFNAFYAQTELGGPDAWPELDIKNAIHCWDNLIDTWADGGYHWNSIRQGLCNQWDQIDATRYVNKDVPESGSFRGYIHKNVSENIRMNNWHPSPDSHDAWAQFLYNWIK